MSLSSLFLSASGYNRSKLAVMMLIPYVLQRAQSFIPTGSRHLPMYRVAHMSTLKVVDTAQDETSNGVYIHVPFCRRRCYYCDFPIKVIGERESTRKSSGEEYTELLVKDISLWSLANSANNIKVDTIYFGGGTPSLLPDHCKSFVDAAFRGTSPSLRRSFSLLTLFVQLCIVVGFLP
jgi:hypothetical protein